MSQLDELVSAYRAECETLGPYELARREAEIRKFASVPDRGSRVDSWLADLLGGSVYVYANRWALYRTGGTETLFQRLEHGLPLGTAVRLMRSARGRLGAKAKNPAAMRRAIAEELARHDRLPPEAVAAATAGATGKTWSTDKEFWAFLRRNVAEFADQSLMDLPEMEREKLAAELTLDIETTFKHHQHRWYNARSSVEKTVKVSKRKLSDALRVLHMDMPRRGADLTAFLRKARYQQRQLSRLYHPDANRGDDSLRAQYEAVIQAYSVVESWVGAREPETDPEPGSRPSLRVVQGGKKE